MRHRGYMGHGMNYLLTNCAVGFFVLSPFMAVTAQTTTAELLNGRRALQCYYNDSNDVYCKELLSGETWKVFSREPDTWERWCGTINCDGTRLTCNDGSVPIVINLDGTNKQAVAPVGTNCHFWRDGSGEDWVVYTAENEAKNRVGTTWKVRIDKLTNKPVESTRVKIADIQFSSGLNGSGVYLGEAYGTAIIKNLVTGEQSPDFNDTRNCVGTMHPGDKPWIMFEESPAHDRVGIFEWNETTGSARRIWRFEKEDVFGLWSPNNENFGLILNNGESAAQRGSLDLVRIVVDTSDTGDNDGSWQIAPMGIVGVLGGPWIERKTGTIQPAVPYGTHGNRLPCGYQPSSHALRRSGATAVYVWDPRGRMMPNGHAGGNLPAGYYLHGDHFGDSRWEIP